MKTRVFFITTVLIVCLPFFKMAQVGKKDQPPKPSAAAVIEKVIAEDGVEAATIKFMELTALGDDAYLFKEADFTNLGLRLFRAEKTIAAREVFKMALSRFPESYYLYLRLAAVHRSLNDPERSRQIVERAFNVRNSKQLSEFLLKNRDNLAVSADEVIQNHLRAIGGRENLQKIKTMTITYSALDGINGETFLVRYYKFPRFIRQDQHVSRTAIASDGEKVWRINAAGWEELPKSNWTYVPDIYGDFIDYESRGISYKLEGIEAVDQHVYYRVQKKFADGEKRDFYFSTESGLFRMERRDFGIGKDIKVYYDYRTVAGVLIPHLFVVTLNGVGFGQTHGAIIQDIKINLPLKDSLFRKSE